MATDPWLAIDAAAPPALRARELRQAWEQFLSEGRVHGVPREHRRGVGAPHHRASICR
jgi:hypothetical protein